jgi:hypothetical protein
MEAITKPIDRLVLKEELNKSKFLRKTNKAGNEIYIITHHDSPYTMREIGRIRELAFRNAGGGTGKEVDIDEYDISKNTPYQQLIVWNPKDEEIIGGYRFIDCREIDTKASLEHQLATSELYHFSDEFINNYLPFTIELGRSFIQPFYQSFKNSKKGIYSLDNLWDGLGALIVDNPEIKHFFGKVTMYTTYNQHARDLILYFLNKYFPDSKKLVYPRNPLKYVTNQTILKETFTGMQYEEAYKVLSKSVRDLNENIPPLINSYMNLSPTMMTFGTANNDGFGGVEETGIMVNIEDIYSVKKERHIFSYTKEMAARLKFKRNF